MKTKQALVIFEDLPIRKIEKDGQVWISALDVAKALGYDNPAQGVNTIIKRNSERFENNLTNHSVDSGKQKRSMKFLNLKGIIAFCLISNMPKAIPFQKWADSVLEKEIKNIPENIRLVAKRKRVEFTDTLKNHGYSKADEYIKTTVDMKKELGIEKKKSDCDLIEVMKIATAEMLAKTKIMIDDKNGFNEVNPVCIESSKIINQNTKKQIIGE